MLPKKFSSKEVVFAAPEWQLIGKTLRSRYKIINKLGSGSFGDTYLAQDLDLPNHPFCVVKQLSPKDSNHNVVSVAKKLFSREASILYRLGKYDQIPSLYAHFCENGSSGDSSDDEFYLVQEFVDGHDLSCEITPTLKWNEAQTVNFMQEILEILVFVHQQGVIHRDIKPQNIMRRKKDGKLVLIDFGAVKEISTLELNTAGQTSFTVSIGTRGYMPPEQLCGHPKLSSDIYAVGMIGIQALTGIQPRQLPICTNTLEVIWRHQVRISDRLQLMLSKMVSYNFSQRYQNASEALQALISLQKTKKYLFF